MKTFFGTGAWPRKSVGRPEAWEQACLFEMLLAGQAALDHVHLGAVARELVDERGAMAAIDAPEGTARNIRRQHVRAGDEPGMRFVGRDGGGGLRKGEVLEHENDHPVVAWVDIEQS